MMMSRQLSFLSVLVTFMGLTDVASLAPNRSTRPSQSLEIQELSRRSMLVRAASITSATFSGLAASPLAASAAADCMKDCVKNCKQIVPNDSSNYCIDTCTDYCNQPDRTDGLSGSVSSEGGEVGILGGTFGTGTVVKGEDKPPSVSLPGLDFKSSSGKKLLGL